MAVQQLPWLVSSALVLPVTVTNSVMIGFRYRGYWINCKRDGPGIQMNANGSIDQGM